MCPLTEYFYKEIYTYLDSSTIKKTWLFAIQKYRAFLFFWKFKNLCYPYVCKLFLHLKRKYCVWLWWIMQKAGYESDQCLGLILIHFSFCGYILGATIPATKNLVTMYGTEWNFIYWQTDYKLLSLKTEIYLYTICYLDAQPISFWTKLSNELDIQNSSRETHMALKRLGKGKVN